MDHRSWSTRVEFSGFSVKDVVEKLQRESEAAQRVARDVLGAAGAPCTVNVPRLFPDASRAYDGRSWSSLRGQTERSRWRSRVAVPDQAVPEQPSAPRLPGSSTSPDTPRRRSARSAR
jgi:hypothetical protein